jgi:hypothetical protein
MSHFIYCYAECRYAESRYAECRFAECRGAVEKGATTLSTPALSITTLSKMDLIVTLSINDTRHSNTWHEHEMSLC